MSSLVRRISASSIAGVAMLFAPEVSAAPQKGKVFDDWVIECERPEGADKDICFAGQTQSMKEGGGRLIHVAVGYLGPKGESALVATVPLGIYLPAGVAFRVGDGAQTPMVIQNCTNKGCRGSVKLDDAMIKQLGAGKVMSFGMLPAANGKTVVIPVSLKGFGAALKSLK